MKLLWFVVIVGIVSAFASWTLLDKDNRKVIWNRKSLIVAFVFVATLLSLFSFAVLGSGQSIKLF